MGVQNVRPPYRVAWQKVTVVLTRENLQTVTDALVNTKTKL